jgi:hypothetical protein
MTSCNYQNQPSLLLIWDYYAQKSAWIHDSHSLFPRKLVLLPSNLTCCTPTKFWLRMDSSLYSVVRMHALSNLSIFHVSNPMPIFRHTCLLSKESVQVRSYYSHFVTCRFCSEDLYAPRPTFKLKDHPLSFVRAASAAGSRPSISKPGRTIPWWQQTHATRCMSTIH